MRFKNLFIMNDKLKKNQSKSERQDELFEKIDRNAMLFVNKIKFPTSRPLEHYLDERMKKLGVADISNPFKTLLDLTVIGTDNNPNMPEDQLSLNPEFLDLGFFEERALYWSLSMQETDLRAQFLITPLGEMFLDNLFNKDYAELCRLDAEPNKEEGQDE